MAIRGGCLKAKISTPFDRHSGTREAWTRNLEIPDSDLSVRSGTTVMWSGHIP
jgi:hypothetical protein